jgi:hypothetical protein
MPKTRSNNGAHEIFDPIRKKWVVLTDEEKVRQFCLQQLVENHKFPISLIAVEKQINVNGLTKRYDIVVFNKEGNPYIVIECKAPHIPINQIVLEQAGRYNKTLQAEIVGVCNGAVNRFFKIDFETELITEIPFVL